MTGVWRHRAAAAARAFAGALLVAAGTGADAHPQRSDACEALRDCLAGRAVCVLVQLPRAQRAQVTGSEAFEDMESRVAAWQARQPALRYAVVNDLARLVSGLPADRGLRMVFVAGAGRAFDHRGLYADDPGWIEAHLATGTVPEAMRAAMTAATVQRRSDGACQGAHITR